MAVTLAIVVPCYNEAAVIERFHAELVRALAPIADVDWQLHFVDDGSTDGTLERLNALAQRDRRVRVYSLSRNFGHQVALTAGLDATRGLPVVMMDADLQHPPEILPSMIAKWREGYDVVSAVREDTDGASWFKRATAAGFYWLINRFGDTAIVPTSACCRRARTTRCARCPSGIDSCAAWCRGSDSTVRTCRFRRRAAAPASRSTRR